MNTNTLMMESKELLFDAKKSLKARKALVDVVENFLKLKKDEEEGKRPKTFSPHLLKALELLKDRVSLTFR
jgi:hypothetical protein